MNHTFFFSYAHNDQKSVPLIRKFFEELRDEVRNALGVDSKDDVAAPLDERIGFLDREVHKVGASWPESLAAALQNTPVLVALYSNTYFNRPYCGKEMQVFLERQQHHRNLHQKSAPTIIPVVWYPYDSIPATVRHIELEEDTFGEVYRTGGVHTLRRINKHRDAYNEYLTLLAQRIKAAMKFQLEPLASAPVLADVANAFAVDAMPSPGETNGAVRRAGPASVGLIYVAATQRELRHARVDVDLGRYGAEGWQWIPYDSQPVGNLAIDIAREKGLHPMELRVEDPLLPRLKAAEDNNSPVVLIVDARTLRIDVHRKRMADYDTSNLLNCAAVVVWDKQLVTAAERAEVQQLAQRVFKANYKTRRPDFFKPSIHTADDLRTEMGSALDTIQLNLLSNGDPQRDMGPGTRPPTL